MDLYLLIQEPNLKGTVLEYKVEKSGVKYYVQWILILTSGFLVKRVFRKFVNIPNSLEEHSQWVFFRLFLGDNA